MLSLRFSVGGPLALMLTACLDSTPVCGNPRLCEDSDPVVRGEESREPLACESLDERARELLESYQHCEVDNDCVATTVEAGCLSPFLCTVAVASNASLDALEREALALRSEVETCFAMGRHRSCAVARCAAGHSLRLSCDRGTNRCIAKYDSGQTQPPTPVDEPTVNAGDASKADTRFSCTKVSDCAVKNVGNCCGYYPRCANVDAVFMPPDCSGGQGGVCGWPEITSCECRANICVSLQNGQQI